MIGDLLVNHSFTLPASSKQHPTVKSEIVSAEDPKLVSQYPDKDESIV